MTGTASTRMPAEWEPQDAVWVSPPHNAETWPGCLDEAQEQFALLYDAIREVVAVRPVESLGIETNDSWIRDFGPIFTHDADGAVRCHDFGYNSYGGKFPPWDLDNAVPPPIARAARLPMQSHEAILEGGSIEPNGCGLLLTTEQCLLTDTRNPTMARDAVEAMLSRWLGAKRVIWLPLGLTGDDTDGHIDNVARFLSEDVVAVVSPEREHKDYERMAVNRRLLRDAGLTLVDLPMPEPVVYRFPEGRPYESGLMPLPASYANFLISNGCVFLPVFGQRRDDVAAKALEAAMPGYRIVPIRSERLLVGMGGIHCLTCHQPAARGAAR